MGSHRKSLGLLLLLFLGVVVSSSPVLEGTGLFGVMPLSRAQSTVYLFSIQNESVHVHALKNGGLLINYTIVFVNLGDPIDIIDVGFPSNDYTLSSVRAFWDDGSGFQELDDIRVSTEIDIGVEVHIPLARRISSGETGTLLLWGTNPHMIYNDTQNDGYAGFQFSPTWFGPEYCTTVNQLTTYLHFPEGFFNGTLAKWMSEPTGFYFDNVSLVYYWQQGSHTPTQYTYGISFPADAVDVVFPPPDNINWELLIILFVTVGFVAVFGGILLTTLLTRKKTVTEKSVTKKQYLPPAVAVETMGIHRGLTIVESAVLMETPLNRVVTMIVYGLLRKGLIRFEEGNPPLIFSQPVDASVRPYYYEIMFLKAIQPNGVIDPAILKRSLTTLIQTVVRKLEGYSRKETRTYYERIMQRAIAEIQQASTPTLQAGVFDQYAEWLLIEPEQSKVIQQYDTYHVPPWYVSYYWFFHRPYYRRAGRVIMPPLTTKDPNLISAFEKAKTGIRSGSKGSKPVGLPQIADGIVTSTGNFANAMVVGFSGIASGIANLFIPAPPPTKPRSSTYSGRSCACACACVSCACACAGGGR